MATDPDAQQRLRDEGVIFGVLTPEHAAVIDGLTPHEVDVIVAVMRRLVEADRVSDTAKGPSGPPAFTNFMVF